MDSLYLHYISEHKARHQKKSQLCLLVENITRKANYLESQKIKQTPS